MSESRDLENEIQSQLAKQNSDISKPHLVDFYFYFPAEEAAHQVAGELEGAGFATTVRPGAQGPDWLCLATKRINPDDSELSEMEEWFEELAARFHGEFDGWESEIVPTDNGKPLN